MTIPKQKKLPFRPGVLLFLMLFMWSTHASLDTENELQRTVTPQQHMIRMLKETYIDYQPDDKKIRPLCREITKAQKHMADAFLKGILGPLTSLAAVDQDTCSITFDHETACLYLQHFITQINTWQERNLHKSETFMESAVRGFMSFSLSATFIDNPSHKDRLFLLSHIFDHANRVDESKLGLDPESTLSKLRERKALAISDLTKKVFPEGTLESHKLNLSLVSNIYDQCEGDMKLAFSSLRILAPIITSARQNNPAIDISALLDLLKNNPLPQGQPNLTLEHLTTLSFT